MRKIQLLIALVLFFSCTEKQKSNSDFYDKVLSVVIENSNGKPVEFPELYDTLADTIAGDKYEKLKLVEKLKTKGFKITDWGRGNYPPLSSRIIIVTMQKEDCKCEVAKIYYSTISGFKYSMTERISCNKASRKQKD